jgi:hypothetical protein
MDAAALLFELCARLGVCLSKEAQDRLIADPPADVDEFVSAVLRADGGEPEATDVRLVRRVRLLVEAGLRDPGDPLLPGPAFDAYGLLYDLCVRLGYCLPPESWDALMSQPPLDVDAFAKAVFLAEGIPVPGRQAWRDVQGLVEQHFRDQGLPT